VDPQHLVAAVNAVASPPPLAPRFALDQNECALEFLHVLLESLDLQPGHLTTFQEEGTCVLCGTVYRQVPLMSFRPFTP
jgi:hypothetical protein